MDERVDECEGHFCRRGKRFLEMEAKVDLTGQLATQASEDAERSVLASERTEKFVREKFDQVLLAHQSMVARTVSSQPPGDDGTSMAVPIDPLEDEHTDIIKLIAPGAHKKLTAARLERDGAREGKRIAELRALRAKAAAITMGIVLGVVAAIEIAKQLAPLIRGH